MFVVIMMSQGCDQSDFALLRCRSEAHNRHNQQHVQIVTRVKSKNKMHNVVLIGTYES